MSGSDRSGKIMLCKEGKERGKRGETSARTTLNQTRRSGKTHVHCFSKNRPKRGTAGVRIFRVTTKCELGSILLWTYLDGEKACAHVLSTGIMMPVRCQNREPMILKQSVLIVHNSAMNRLKPNHRSVVVLRLMDILSVVSVKPQRYSGFPKVR